jgi:hypothetical protein
VSIYLGVHSNDIAYDHRRFFDTAQYVKVQTPWANWFFGMLIVDIASGCLLGIILAMSATHNT